MTDYIVRRGDSLSSIARSQLDAESQWPKIAEANRLKPPYLLLIGMKLRIPAKDARVPLQQSRDKQSARVPFQQSRDKQSAPVPLTQSRAASQTRLPDQRAMEIAWPNCSISINEAQELQYPYGKAVLKFEGTLRGSKPGSFTWESGGKLTESSLFQKVKVEYGSDVAKALFDAKFEWNSVTKENQLTFVKYGWQFAHGSYQFVFPKTHVFTFAEQPVKLDRFSGKLKPIVEITPNDERNSSNPEPIALKLRQSAASFEIKLDRSQPVFSPGAMDFGEALELILLL